MIRSSKVYDLDNTLKPSGCAEYKVVMNQRSWATFAQEMLIVGQGHLHELLGGSFGFKSAFKNSPSLTAKDPAYWGRYAFVHRKRRCHKDFMAKGLYDMPILWFQTMPFDRFEGI